MEVKEAIQARRSIRKFQDQPVSREELMELLDAARLAPSAINAQPWRFKIVDGKDDIQWLSGSPTRGQKWVGGAGAVIVCCADLQRFLEDARAGVRFLRDNAVLPPEMLEGVENYVSRAESSPTEVLRGAAGMNCSIALTHIMLRAVELGLGTCWIGAFYEDRVREILKVPQPYRIVALTPLGYPAQEGKFPGRKGLDEVVAYETWS